MARSTFEMKVEGLKELEDALKELPKATGRNVIRRALTEAAQPMVQTASADAPRGLTGHLKQSIAVSKVRFSKGDAGKQAYAEALKRGASRAEAVAALREANSASDVEVTSGIVEIGPARSSGIDPFYAHFVEFGTVKMSAKPFMRPAYESNKFKCLDIMKEALKVEIDKAVARIAKKQARAIAQAKLGG